jgi:hypothetical protein
LNYGRATGALKTEYRGLQNQMKTFFISYRGIANIHKVFANSLEQAKIKFNYFMKVPNPEQAIGYCQSHRKVSSDTQLPTIA